MAPRVTRPAPAARKPVTSVIQLADPRGDIPNCKTHTRENHKVGEPPVRLAPCMRVCWIVKEANDTDKPLTRFLVALAAYTTENLVKADASKAASYYKIREDWAVAYIRMEKQRRGLRA